MERKMGGGKSTGGRRNVTKKDKCKKVEFDRPGERSPE